MSTVDLRERIFNFLTHQYVQSQDDRQKKMGLQYTTAETHDLADSLAAALQVEDLWQPIHTAPQDGTRVLTCYFQNGHACDYQVNFFNDPEKTRPGLRLGKKGWWCSCPNQQPTHWQPLTVPGRQA